MRNMKRQTYIVGVHPWGATSGESIACVRTIREAWRVVRTLWQRGRPWVSNWRGTRFLWPMEGTGQKYKDGKTARLLREG